MSIGGVVEASLFVRPHESGLIQTSHKKLDSWPGDFRSSDP
jgi:hypothetical protein